MYQILKNGLVLINAQDMETAVTFMKSLESNLDRNTQHSPYTIGHAPDVETPTEARARVRARIKAQLNVSSESQK